jgi:hypothetical protein
MVQIHLGMNSMKHTCTVYSDDEEEEEKERRGERRHKWNNSVSLSDAPDWGLTAHCNCTEIKPYSTTFLKVHFPRPTGACPAGTRVDSISQGKHTNDEPLGKLS